MSCSLPQPDCQNCHPQYSRIASSSGDWRELAIFTSQPYRRSAIFINEFILVYPSGGRQNHPKDDQLANQSCNCSVMCATGLLVHSTEASIASDSRLPSLSADSRAKASGCNRLK